MTNIDNFHIDVLSETREALRAALSLVYEAHGGQERACVTHWIETSRVPREDFGDDRLGLRELLGYTPEVPCLVLLWGEEQHYQWGTTHPMLAPLDLDGAVEMVWRWLQKQEVPGGEVHSGDVWIKRAFRLFNTNWGHVGPYRYGLCAIQSAQAMIGK